MKLLYSNILPLGTEEDQETIMDCFNEQMKIADRVEIAVGYTSNASLAELDRLVDECGISKVCLNIGMSAMPHREVRERQETGMKLS